MSIRLERLTKRYDDRAVVSNVSLDVSPGEFRVLLGPSGSGKSTILRLIAGLTPADSGSILLEGRDLAGVPARHRGCGFVFQSYALFRRMNVAENVEFALRVRGVSRRERRHRREELLELTGLAGLADRLPSQLSGGQQQRVALARALAHRPSVLLLDEPFGALDARTRTELRRSLRTIHRDLGVTTLFVTHDQDEAFELADRIAVVAQGRLIEEGPPDQLYLAPQTEFVATFLGGANLWVGERTQEGIRLGPVEIPWRSPDEDVTPGDSRRRRVQALVRPEDVAIRRARADLTHPVLGEGVVDSIEFAGSMERLRLRLPALPRVRVIHPPAPFGDDHLAVDAARSRHIARREPLAPGDSVWVGIRRVHALLHPGLAFVSVAPQDSRSGAFAAELARLTQARLAQESAESLPDALGSEAADLVIAPLADRGGAADAEELLASSAGASLLLVRGDRRLPPQRFLVAVAVGEPGKEDVAFTGRLARHTGSAATVVTLLPVAADETDRRAAERFLAGCVRTLAPFGVGADTAIMTGDLGTEIALRMRKDHDLLVIGAPLPDAAGRRRWGAATRELLDGPGDFPILVVRLQRSPARALESR